MSKLKQLVKKSGLVVSGLVASGAVMAADTGKDGAIAAITGSQTTASDFGWAAIAVLAGIAVFKYIKKVI